METRCTLSGNLWPPQLRRSAPPPPQRRLPKSPRLAPIEQGELSCQQRSRYRDDDIRQCEAALQQVDDVLIRTGKRDFRSLTARKEQQDLVQPNTFVAQEIGRMRAEEDLASRLSLRPDEYLWKSSHDIGMER